MTVFKHAAYVVGEVESDEGDRDSPLWRFFNFRCFEPVQRNKDGMRYVGHRFEIKGGITANQVMRRGIAENLMQNNAFFRRLTSRDE